MAHTKNRKTLKIILIAVAVLLMAAAGTVLWLSTHYKGIIRQNLPGWVAGATDSLYKISVADIGINLVSNRVTLTGARIWIDSNRLQYLQSTGRAPETLVDMDIPTIAVRGVNLGALVGAKELSCRMFYLNNPKIIITALMPDTVAITPEEPKKPFIEKISSSLIQIKGADITFRNHKTADSGSYYIQGGNIAFTDWQFVPGSKENRTKPFYGKLGDFEIDSFRYATSTGLYAIQCGNIAAKGNITTVKDFRLKPLYNKKDFYQKVGQEKEIYNIHFPLVALHDFEPEAIINKQTIMASLVELKQAYIDIFYSRIPPDNTKSKVGNYPNQLVQKLQYKTYVKEVKVQGGRFRYTEENSFTMREGSFSIRDINGTVNHISNMPEYLKDNHNCIIKLRGSFMGKSSMAATFNLDLTDTLGGFTVTAEHRNLDAAEINNMVKALAVADIESLHASSIKFTVRGNQYEADGSMTMLYDDLKVKLMKVDDDKKMKKQGLLSFIAQKAIIYESNPHKKDEVRTATMHQKRRPTGSFFNLIWKTAFEGILETTLRTQGAAEYVQDAKPGKKKKGIIQTIKQVMKKEKKEKK